MKLLRLFALLFVPALSFAQFTTVTGTVTDPNGLAYAFGTISAGLVVPSGAGSPTLNGGGYTPPSQPSGLDKAGKFTIRLADNSVLLPASTQWTFLICSAKGTILPAGGNGPVCFTVPALTISGSSQSITSNIAAVPPPALSINPGTGTLSSVSCTVPLACTPNPIVSTGTASCPTCAIGPGSSTANHIAEFAGTDGVTLIDGGVAGTGTLTSVSCTAPLVCTPNPIVTTGSAACATCTTSAASLGSGNVVTGSGGQAMATDSSMTDAAGVMTTSGTSTAACNSISNGWKFGNGGAINTGFTSFGGGAVDFCANGVRAFQSNSSNGIAVESGNMGFFGGKGQHFVTQAANNDSTGTVTVSASTSGSVNFTTSYSNAPNCQLTPQSDPTAIGAYWATSSTSAVTANVHTSGTISFNYHCWGNPN
jgi:hypothetical protein